MNIYNSIQEKIGALAEKILLNLSANKFSFEIINNRMYR